MRRIFCGAAAIILLVVRGTGALSPLPRGISPYEASRTTNNALSDVRQQVATALAAARTANETFLMEVEFPPLLGRRTAFEDVDNVQILNANRDWSMELCAPLATELGPELWLAFPDRRELELAQREWPGQQFQRATLTTIEDAAVALGGLVEQPWGARVSRFVEARSPFVEDGALLGAKPATDQAPSPRLVVAVQPGDGGPLEDWLNLEQLALSTEAPVVVVNGAFDKLRGGYYPPLLFPKLAACVDRFIRRAEPLFYLKQVTDKGRAGWLFRVYPEPWQLLRQARDGATSLLLETDDRPSYDDAVRALLTR